MAYQCKGCLEYNNRPQFDLCKVCQRKEDAIDFPDEYIINEDGSIIYKKEQYEITDQGPDTF